MDISFPGNQASFLLGILLFLWMNVAVASVTEASPAANAPNQAEIRIEDQTIFLRLEIGQDDFDRVIEFAKKQQRELESLLAEIIQFEVNGKPLKPTATRYLGTQARRLPVPDGTEIATTWVDSFTHRPDPTASDSNEQTKQSSMRHTVETTLSHPAKDADRLRLKLTPFAASANDHPLLSIGLIVFHEQIPVTEHRLLSQAEILVLDQHDPWFSHFENPLMNRTLRSIVTGALYVEPAEVRQEIIIRLSDLLAWLSLPEIAGKELTTATIIENRRYVPTHRQNMLKEQIATLLMTHNTLSIEGQPQRAIFDRIDYLVPGAYGLMPADPSKPLDIQTTFIGMVFAYITSRYPSKITLHWSVFPPDVRNVPVTAFDLTGQLDTYVTPGSPLFEWEDLLDEYDFLENQAALQEARNAALDIVQVPATSDRQAIDDTIAGAIFMVLGLGMILLLGLRHKISPSLTRGSGMVLLLLTGFFILYKQDWLADETHERLLDETRARQIVTQLLKNIYRSFDFRDEHDIYDKLAGSVHGKLLEVLYLQNRQAQLRAQAGGSRIRVQHVEVTETKIDRMASKSTAYHIDTSWIAQGSVAHWGHVHQRQNRYQARLAIEPVDGIWKLTRFELMDEQRIDQQNAQP